MHWTPFFYYLSCGARHIIVSHEAGVYYALSTLSWRDVCRLEFPAPPHLWTSSVGELSE